MLPYSNGFLFDIYFLLQIGGVHHYGVILHDRLFGKKRAVRAEALLPEHIMARIAAPVLRAHLMIALHDLVAADRRGGAAPLADEVVLTDSYEESCKQKSIAEMKKVPQNLHS